MPSQQLLTALGEALGSGALVQELLAVTSAGSSSDLTFTVTDPAYGAAGDGIADDTLAIQAAIDAAELVAPATVIIPPGTYKVSSLLLDGDHVAIKGYKGSCLLMHEDGCGTVEGSAMLLIKGNHCLVEDLEFDGNIAALPPGKNRCIQINGTVAGTGTGVRLNKLYCHDTYNYNSDSTADTIQIVNGVDCVVERCYSLRAGWNGIRVSGEANRVEFNVVEDYLGRGIRFNQGESGWVTDNIVKTSDVASGAALLADPEDTQFGTWNCERNRVYIKSTRVHSGSTGTNAIKVARTKHAVLRDNEVEIGVDTYSTGTVVYDDTGGAVEYMLTLTDGTWPTWALSPARIFFNGDWYTVDARISDTVIQLDDTDNPGSDVGSTTYFLEQMYDNIGIRLEDGNDHVEIQGGRTDQILMTDGMMAGAISAHADNGAGLIRFTQTAHGWTDTPTPGDNGRIVYVTGSSVLEYNTKHIFTYVDANTWDSDRAYVAGTIGSAKAHGATDILTVRNVHFGRGTLTKLSQMENIKARVFDIEGCLFDGRHDEALNDAGDPFDPDNAGGANGAIEWAMPDNAYDLLRIVNNEFIAAHAGANCRLVSLEDETTQLILAGKMIAHDNRVRNIGAGGSALMCLTTSNASRAQLFATSGENPSEFRGSAAPTAGTWAVGHTVWNTTPGASGLVGWICTAAGTPGTWRPIYGNDLLSSNVTEVANGTTVETDLMTYSLPDTDALSNAVMGTNGEGLEIDCGFSFAANGNTKTVKFYLGASEIYTSGAAAHNGGAMTLRVRIMRDGSAAAQKCHVTAIVTGTGTPFVDKVQYTATTVNLATAATVIKATGTSGTASTDVVQEWMTVRHLRIAG